LRAVEGITLRLPMVDIQDAQVNGIGSETRLARSQIDSVERSENNHVSFPAVAPLGGCLLFGTPNPPPPGSNEIMGLAGIFRFGL
jgi:hypothetical protein